MDMRAILEKAKRDLAAVTGLKPVSVVQTFRDDQGWHVRVEMLEISRIPPATDVLGDYEVILDEDGAMLRFERKRTRLRGESMEEQLAV